ncbi:MAG: tRNA (adenosine(37)-N6)-threonylcarbamoyltransferase complex transferase subunit TsaD, partial [Clostridia bacterium]|nr:tRNA (adenosine(37)-N6)-threonylcarbamoyltransferase complex transferase subunit TsaD [Clostridia bacterium]
MLILSFESSCDETSVAIASFHNGDKKVLANKTATQIAIHALYGGVVPEIAGRAHIEAISALTYAAFEEAGVTVSDIDAVAVTSEPGLIGALLVAVNYAKSFALAHDLPLIPVNHIRAHIAAVYYEYPDLEAPFFAMVASGGHTSLIDVRSPTEFVTVGRTRDDAIGEAFDKVARVLGMPYPGGAEMDRLAGEGNP